MVSKWNEQDVFKVRAKSMPLETGLLPGPADDGDDGGDEDDDAGDGDDEQPR